MHVSISYGLVVLSFGIFSWRCLIANVNRQAGFLLSTATPILFKLMGKILCEDAVVFNFRGMAYMM